MGEHWGPFRIAPLRVGDVQRGWGGACSQHSDARQPHVKCQKWLSYRRPGLDTLQPDACRCLLKQWLLAGAAIARDDPNGKTLHLQLDPRLFAPRPERRP